MKKFQKDQKITFILLLEKETQQNYTYKRNYTTVWYQLMLMVTYIWRNMGETLGPTGYQVLPPSVVYLMLKLDVLL